MPHGIVVVGYDQNYFTMAIRLASPPLGPLASPLPASLPFAAPECVPGTVSLVRPYACASGRTGARVASRRQKRSVAK